MILHTLPHRGAQRPRGRRYAKPELQQCSRVFPSCKLPLGSILFTEHSFLPRARSVSSGRQNKALDWEAQTTETYSLHGSADQKSGIKVSVGLGFSCGLSLFGL